ncbi:L-carnitine dehydrogenase [Kiloniella laminariae]|uniref:L-carnitine dehydrogenase n=1 Tax=Kiloniella laminariae TaxID=454162 RepID=UPI00036A8E76|nr:L-carnitine dehydrogenase [Kiloniella laminariae]
MSREIKTVAIVGAGVIGAGWAARCLHRGINVVVTDVTAAAERGLREVIANAEPALANLSLAPRRKKGMLSFTTNLAEAVAQADFVQENAPEREDLKRGLLAEISKHVGPDVIIASSSSGLLPTRIQADCIRPERVLIGHPFNPVYLLPLVEVLGGEKTEERYITEAMAFYTSIGMHALKVRKEIEGYISDRLQEALWRETLHMVAEGVATTDEIDQAIIYGPGLRWAFMGTCLTFHLAGGEQGMRHMLEQFGPALQLPWTKLKAPELTDQLIDRMVEGTQEQSKGYSIRDLEQLRDNCLVSIMQSLRTFNYASGRTLKEDDERQYQEMNGATEWAPSDDLSRPLELHSDKVHPEWVDYNGHMTESRYLQVFGDASDALYRYVGVNDVYHAQGNSYYTVETHIYNVKEVAAQAPLKVTTQLLGLDNKRLHFVHNIYHAKDNTLLATGEQMVLHVDTAAGKACPAKPEVLDILQKIMDAHSKLPQPDYRSREMAVPPAKG